MAFSSFHTNIVWEQLLELWDYQKVTFIMHEKGPDNIWISHGFQTKYSLACSQPVEWEIFLGDPCAPEPICRCKPVKHTKVDTPFVLKKVDTPSMHFSFVRSRQITSALTKVFRKKMLTSTICITNIYHTIYLIIKIAWCSSYFVYKVGQSYISLIQDQVN